MTELQILLQKCNDAFNSDQHQLLIDLLPDDVLQEKKAAALYVLKSRLLLFINQNALGNLEKR